jgi:hypothetical protein
MPGPHGFAVRSNVVRLARRLITHRQACPAIALRADAAASTASHPAFVTIAIRPSCRERTGRAGRTDLPDGESEIFFERGLDDPNHVEMVQQIAIYGHR